MTITAAPATASANTAPDLSAVKPLPAWFFVFEGSMGAAYDLCKAWENAWMILVAMGLANLVVGLTVLRGRTKLVKAMLKNSRTRWITAGLIALRVCLHGVLILAGAEITSAAGHLVLAVVMAATGTTLLWFDQRVTFRALGLPTARH
ncbi:hypothetical protein [Streptomyces sp. NPDC049585]|uniref:hypothetical protein n=1 Tax=Streptomyces sp. NPDC049585 TaxID=3155154 RepID=UPI003425C878